MDSGTVVGAKVEVELGEVIGGVSVERGKAGGMLKGLWEKLGAKGSPESMVVLGNKKGKWVLHW